MQMVRKMSYALSPDTPCMAPIGTRATTDLENEVRFFLAWLFCLLACTPRVGQRPGKKKRTERMPATQHSVVVHVAAAQAFELGVLIKT